MTTDCDVVVIGAGPYGLAATAHLRRAGVSTHVLGDPMSFWRTMPEGMLLRSNRTATSIAEYDGPLSLETYAAARGWDVEMPVPLERFIDYGTWVQETAAPDVDRRRVQMLRREGGAFVLDLDDGDRLRAARVVIACGIADFVHRPVVGADLPPELMTHASEHRDLGRFAGRRVLVVGGGQSALESAALMHERGARVEVAVRAEHINWLHGGVWHRRLGRATPLVYAPTDVGPMGLSRLVAVPDLFGRLPRTVADPLAYRAIRPAGAAWLRPRLADVRITFGAEMRTASPTADGGVRVRLSDGGDREVDHVLLGTGYRVDIRRYPFLHPTLVAGIRTTAGYPRLRRGMETSVPGLHIVGAPAARSFGPTMRFVSGSWYTGRELARSLAGAPPAPLPRFAPAA
ncbi:NAD(P)-binding domain-containing protein [Actinomycetospora lutea]|uniref:FAD-dependent oxidoreductase n=1 Tax=Actinomycetospora lutea TaxID=663604 RepID=UPI002365FE22|nr:FAD-dependent oxidoreductase [Actinomycetospora lutea]MDD7941995.1 NAD(P)-binding domain-containing protein [Actinomycetospora lutea]